MPILFTLRAVALAAFLSLLAGGLGGWVIQGWRLDNAVTKQQLLEEQLKSAALQQNLTTIAAVLGLDAKAAAEGEVTLEEIDALAEKVVQAATDKPALSAATVDSLRDLWDRK